VRRWRDETITFPPVDEVRKAYRDKHVWEHVKAAMITAGKIPGGSYDDGRCKHPCGHLRLPHLGPRHGRA